MKLYCDILLHTHNDAESIFDVLNGRILDCNISLRQIVSMY